ncbi:hypothetical protein SNEBB_007843 [Seison nebaliae]|nr:hypothetical protein SNEBB_007843 [Seison nebaliae]
MDVTMVKVIFYMPATPNTSWEYQESIISIPLSNKCRMTYDKLHSLMEMVFESNKYDIEEINGYQYEDWKMVSDTDMSTEFKVYLYEKKTFKYNKMELNRYGRNQYNCSHPLFAPSTVPGMNNSQQQQIFTNQLQKIKQPLSESIKKVPTNYPKGTDTSYLVKREKIENQIKKNNVAINDIFSDLAEFGMENTKKSPELRDQKMIYMTESIMRGLVDYYGIMNAKIQLMSTMSPEAMMNDMDKMIVAARQRMTNFKQKRKCYEKWVSKQLQEKYFSASQEKYFNGSQEKYYNASQKK